MLLELRHGLDLQEELHFEHFYPELEELVLRFQSGTMIVLVQLGPFQRSLNHERDFFRVSVGS